jgi:hypothetical protein
MRKIKMNSGGGLQGFRVRGIRTAGGGREEGDCLMWIDILQKEVAGAISSKHKTDISRPGPKVPLLVKTFQEVLF